jgi:hypothetical protein
MEQEVRVTLSISADLSAEEIYSILSKALDGVGCVIKIEEERHIYETDESDVPMILI